MKWNNEIIIGQKTVSITNPTYFIADLAANHDGDMGRAKDLIHLAKEAGADCAKFQHFLPEKIVSQTGFDDMKTQTAHQAGWRKTVVEVYDQYHFRREWTQPLAELCQSTGIEFMSTPYDYDAIREIVSLVPAIKIGSGDITWINFIEEIAKTQKPCLLATGASTMTDVELAVDAICRYNKSIVLMQCNTNYTGSDNNFNHVNLNVLKAFSIRYPQMVLGLSDHTSGHSTVLGAVALGARVVEKHFTDDNAREGPDHSFAMNPKTWANMIDRTRELEAALGTGVKGIEPNEDETVVVQRRAIRLTRDVEPGHQLASKDVDFLRPCPLEAIDPRNVNKVLGRPLTIKKKAGQHLVWSDLQ